MYTGSSIIMYTEFNVIEFTNQLNQTAINVPVYETASADGGMSIKHFMADKCVLVNICALNTVRYFSYELLTW